MKRDVIACHSEIKEKENKVLKKNLIGKSIFVIIARGITFFHVQGQVE
jgi:hypothetical protein